MLLVLMDQAMLDAMGMGDAEDEDYDEDDIVAALMTQIEEKDGQLRMAAEIGQSLLAKNEALGLQVEELREENERLDAALEEVQYRNEELEENMAQVGDAEDAELEQLQQAHDALVAQLEVSQSEESKLRSMLESTEEDIKQFKAVLQQDASHVWTPRGHHIVPPEDGAPAENQEEGRVAELSRELSSVRQENKDALREQAEAAVAERHAHEREVARQKSEIESLEAVVAGLQRQADAWATERTVLDESALAARLQAERAELQGAQLSAQLGALQSEFAKAASMGVTATWSNGSTVDEGVPPTDCAELGESLGESLKESLDDQLVQVPELSPAAPEPGSEPEPEPEQGPQSEPGPAPDVDKPVAPLVLEVGAVDKPNNSAGSAEETIRRLLDEKDVLLRENKALLQRLSGGAEPSSARAARARARTLVAGAPGGQPGHASQRPRTVSDATGSARELRVGGATSSSAKGGSPLASSSSASNLEVEGLAKLQKGLTKAPEAVAAAKAAEQAALKELAGSAAETATDDATAESGDKAGTGGTTKRNKVQSDQVVDDPMWQYFYLTAMSHKIGKPLLAEIPLTTEDLLGLFKKAKADENMTFDRWPSWLIKEMTGLAMAFGYMRGGGRMLARRRENAVPAVDKRLLLTGGDFYTFEKTKMKGVARRKMLLQISKDLSMLEFRPVGETVSVDLSLYDTVHSAAERWSVQDKATEKLKEKVCKGDQGSEDLFFSLSGHKAPEILDLMAPDERQKDLWCRSLTKIFHEQEIAMMMDPGALGDDETMRAGTLTAKEQRRRKKDSTPEKVCRPPYSSTSISSATAYVCLMFPCAYRAHIQPGRFQ